METLPTTSSNSMASTTKPVLQDVPLDGNQKVNSTPVAAKKPTHVTPNADASEEPQAKKTKYLDDIQRSIDYEQASKDGVVPKEGNTICSILVSNLKTPYGHSKAEHTISLLVQQHGLFDLVLQAFELLHKENLTEDSYNSHLWSITFGKTKYHNGWRGTGGEGPNKHCDAQDPVALKDLTLSKGQTGKFAGESAGFDFIVQSVESAPQDGAAKYPVARAVAQTYSNELVDDWLTSAQQQECLQVRQKWEAYFNGPENGTKRGRGSQCGEIVTCKPDAPQWQQSEIELMGLLINAGHKFAKSWKFVLQYALVDRTKNAASGYWYKLQKKEPYRLEYIGTKLTGKQKVMLVKKLSKARVASLPTPPTKEEILQTRRKMENRQQNLREGRFDLLSDEDEDDFMY